MSEVVVSLFHVRDERTVQSRIKEAVEDYSRTYKTEDSQVKLLYESGGKPYLESRAVELSISHSGELWGCALSKEPVGLDIQLIREKGVCSVAKRFFHPEEYRYLQETGFSSVIMLFHSYDRFYFKKRPFGKCRHFHTGPGGFVVSEPFLINCIDCRKIIDIV